MNDTMRAVVVAEDGSFVLRRLPIPRPGPGEALVRVRLASICGTDVSVWKGLPHVQSLIRPPVVIGHEFTGDIIAVGEGVDPRRIGERISAEPYVVCGRCPMCMDGRANLCRDLKGIGYWFDGGFAEYCVLPEQNAYPVSAQVDDACNALMQPLATVVYAATKVAAAGKTAAVVGCGPMGLMAVSVLRAMGARRIFAVEPDRQRGETALAMGASAALDPAGCDAAAEMLRLCGGLGPDIVLECSGSAAAIRQALDYIAPGGEFLPIALPAGEIPVDFTGVFYKKGVNIYGVNGRELYHTWKIMAGLLEAGMDVSACVSHTFDLDHFAEAFRLAESGKCLKVMLKP